MSSQFYVVGDFTLARNMTKL